MKKIVFFFLISFVAFSCKKKNLQATKEFKKPKFSTVKNYAKPDVLDKYAEIEIENWKEYTDLSLFLKRFEKTSPSQALNSTIELRDLIKKIKDSVNPEILENNAFKARINVLQNEALRLTDMSYIGSIKADEVDTQITKILAVFGSINQKINTVYSQKRFEEAVKINGVFENSISKDLTPEKQIEKKTVRENKKNTVLNKEFISKKKGVKKITSKEKLQK